ncbi:MAG: hypothetical protein ACI8X3_003386, partial [Saprospiraceae bacterium]
PQPLFISKILLLVFCLKKWLKRVRVIKEG